MGESAVLRTLSHVFGPFDRELWLDLTNSDSWTAFLNEAQAVVSADAAASPSAASVFSGLSAAPDVEAHESFASRCLTGGLPTSAVPVESFYFVGEDGCRSACYLQEPALYMKSVFDSLGLDLPDAFAAMPDHLSLELEIAALYWDLGLADQARLFLRERTAWLPAYRLRLAEASESNDFYLSCIDLILMLASPGGRRGLKLPAVSRRVTYDEDLRRRRRRLPQRA